MPLIDGTDPIDDEEILYRRIPVSQGWYNSNADPHPSPQAFRPRDDDITGISLCRGGLYNTVEQAGHGPSKKGYFVAVLKAGDLRKLGFDVVPRPNDVINGHVEIPALTASNRDTDSALNIMTALANKLCLRVEGPFSPPVG